jgi:hypothetical protein
MLLIIALLIILTGPLAAAASMSEWGIVLAQGCPRSGRGWGGHARHPTVPSLVLILPNVRWLNPPPAETAPGIHGRTGTTCPS